MIMVPDDLERRLSSEPAAEARFDAMPPSHRRESLKWIEEARKEETRRRRIEKTLSMLLERDK